MAKKIKTKKAIKKVVKKAIKKATPKKAIKKSAKKITLVKKAAKKSVLKLKSKPAKKATQSKSKKSVFVAHQTHLKAGMPAPAFSGLDQNGNEISLGQLKGKTVILYFYPKDDTPGCTATACSLRNGYEHLAQLNYAIVGVSADDVKSHAKFAKKYELPFPLIADTQHHILKAYDVWGKKQFMGRISDGIIRTTFIIAPNGILKEVITKVETATHTEQILGNV